jgi:hypothetical protein
MVFGNPHDQLDLQREDNPQVAMATVGTNVPGGGWPGCGRRGESRLSIPHVSKELICKYLTDLKLIGALEK